MGGTDLLLLGGTGILSAAICNLATEKNLNVTIINRGRKKETCNKKVKLIISDLKNDRIEEIENKIKGMNFDAVIDFISYKESELEKNIQIFASICQQYIFISTATIYRNMGKDHVYKEDDPIDNNEWKYCIDKAMCENKLRQLAKEKNFYYTIVRPYVTYGKTRLPYQISPLKYYTIINRIKNDKPIPISNMDTKCTVTSVEDFSVGVIGLILNQRAYDNTFHITSIHSTTWKNILELTADTLGKRVCFVDFTNDFLINYSNKGIDTDEILGDKARDMLFDNSRIQTIVPEYEGNIKFEDKVDEVLNYFESDEGHCEIDYLWDGAVDRYINKFQKRKYSLKFAGEEIIANKLIYWAGRNSITYYLLRIIKKWKK